MDILHLIDLTLLIQIGILGFWRWSSWMVKFCLSACYRTPPFVESTQNWKLTAVVPVKGEPPEIFERLLNGLINERVDEACIVLFHEEHENIRLVQTYAKKYAHRIKMRYQLVYKPGKRLALSTAIAMVGDDADVIMCLDSDTFLGDGVRAAVLSAFSDPRIGGVTVAQRVWKPTKLIHHLFDIRLFLRFTQDIPGQALGRRVSVMSGRCAAYRAEPLRKEMGPKLLHERWMGIHKTGGGDDKWLTTLIHDLGYETTLVRTACVYTDAADTVSKYLSQSLRWSRNTWFADFRAVFSRRWLWDSPILAFYTLDRMVNILVVLIPPWIMFWALFQANWILMGLLLGWWLLSRSAKLSLYLLTTGRVHMVLPYILMNYVENVVKIHALITLKDNSWMTRGERGVNVWLYVSWSMTAMFVMMVGVLVLMRQSIF